MKLAPVYKAFNKYEVKQQVLHTGQHYDNNLSEIFRMQFGLPQTTFNLGLKRSANDSYLGKCISEIDKILRSESPDIVVVYGDTDTTAAGAIAASKLNIPLAHVEAGLRENDKSIPEEINKLITDAVSDFLFAPSKTAMRTLELEGKSKNSYFVGDTGLDTIKASIKQIAIGENMLIEHGLSKGEYILCTCHRAANTENKLNLESILKALSSIKETIIFPIHPRTKKAITTYQLGALTEAKNIRLIDPIGFFEIQALLKNANFCITDSGGLIKEAYYHKIPSIIIDKQTEWLEIVNEGWSILAGPNYEAIMNAAENIQRPDYYQEQYGDGTAGEKIADICINFLNGEI